MAFTRAPLSAVLTDANGYEINLGGGSGPFTRGPISVVVTDKNGVAMTVGTGSGGGGTAPTVQTANTSGNVSFSSATQTTVFCTTGAVGIGQTLPTAVGIAGNNVTLKKVDTGVGPLNIGTTSAQTIDGTLYGTSYIIGNYMQYVTLQSDGANWFIIGGN